MINVNGKDKYWLRVIVPIKLPEDNPVVDVLKKDVESVLPDDVFVEVVHLDTGSACIECRAQLEENAPHVMRLVQNSGKKQEKGLIDGIFVSDMDMCGVEASRELVDIPVIGGFRASAYTAMLLGQKFSIISITPSIKEYQVEHCRTFGIESNFASIIPTNLAVEKLIDSYTDSSKRDDIVENVLKHVLNAINESGADSIIFGCTGFINIAEEVHEKLKTNYDINIPILPPNKTAILYLYNLVKNNFMQSRQTYYKFNGKI